MKQHVIALAAAVYAVAAMAAAAVVIAAVWVGERAYVRDGASDVCGPATPARAVVNEGSPPHFDFSLLPYGYRCAWNSADGQTLLGDPRWAPTNSLIWAVALVLSAVVVCALLAVRRVRGQRRGGALIASNPMEGRLMRPLVLSGGPAVGKSTCGRRLAAQQARAAFVDVDDIRQLIVSGDATLWSGPEGESQHLLAALNASAVGRNLIAAGFDVTIADVVTAGALALYREELPDCFIVHLAVSLDEALRRARTRAVYLTDEEFELVHELMTVPPDVDLVLDVTGMTLDEQTDSIRAAWNRSSGSVQRRDS